jgi:DNA primase
VGGRISERTLREIREKADIAEVISEFVPLSRSGASFRGLCPFHREKTPSFFVNPGRQIFHCFGCGEGGSALHFLMKARRLSFVEAVEELGDRYGVPIEYEKGGAPRRPQEDLFRILGLAAETYRELLRSAPGGRPVRELLLRRGVTSEAEREFSLGYGGSGRDLLEALARAGVDPARAEAAGLLLSAGGGRYRERFQGRLVFPIADGRGRVCGFGARAVGNSLPKYINSPESELYRKSAVLYGLFQALPSIRRDGRVVVVEGYMDLIGLWQKGVRSVVATCGTALTESQARTLKRLSDSVILLFDGDAAGKRSALRAGGPLYAAGVSPLVLFPPRGMDPDDWAKTVSGADITERIGQAIPLMDYLEKAAARKFDLSEIPGKLSYLRFMTGHLQRIMDGAEQRLYAQRVARTAGLPEETVLEQVRGKKVAVPPATGAAPGGAEGPGTEDDLLLHILARDPSLLADVLDDGVADLLEDDEVRGIIAALVAAAGGEPADLAAVLDGEVPDAVRKRVSQGILGEGRLPGEPRRIYPDLVLRLKIRRVDRELGRLRAAGASARGEAASSLLAEVVTLVRERGRLVEERRKCADEVSRHGKA